MTTNTACIFDPDLRQPHSAGTDCLLESWPTNHHLDPATLVPCSMPHSFIVVIVLKLLKLRVVPNYRVIDIAIRTFYRLR